LRADTLQLSAYTAQKSRLAQPRRPGKHGRTSRSQRPAKRVRCAALPVRPGLPPPGVPSLAAGLAIILPSPPICLDRGGARHRRFFQAPLSPFEVVP
jgi:hypothetical protein